MTSDLERIKKQEEILRIVAFYDIFSFPLTIFEIKKALFSLNTLSDLENILGSAPMVAKLERKNGFYFLKGRREIIDSRNRRYNYSSKKIRTAKFFAKIFVKLPFILGIYLANSIGAYNLREESDIDFFIITKSKRIWLSRFFCAGLMKLLNKRPNKRTKKNKICLSFYLSENNLNLSDLKIKSGDPYFDFWEKNLLLLEDKNNINQKFLEVNGLAAYYDLSLTQGQSFSKLNQSSKKGNSLTVNVFNYLEKLSYRLQVKIMPALLREAAEMKDGLSGVVLSDNIIKLYLKDRRLEIKKKYEEKLAKII